MIQVRIHVPLEDNTGVAFSRDYHRTWENWLSRTFGGWTLEGTVLGAWVAPSGTIREETAVYMVAVPGLLEASSGLRAAVDFLLSHYDQQAVLVSYLGQSEVLS